MPSKLFRYRDLNEESIEFRIGEIARGELYLSHPKELNDPLEATSLLHSSSTYDYPHKKDLYENQFRKSLSDTERKDIFDDEHWLEKLHYFVAVKSADKRNPEEIINLLKDIMREEYERLNCSISDTARQMVRLACFTTKANNLPMWNHYANAHKGICLEYDTTNITDIYQINRLFPVVYGSNMPDCTYMLQKGDKALGLMYDYMAMHKLEDWKYEDEWRMIYNVGSWYFSPEDVPPEFWARGKVIYFIKPSRIILGAEIEEKFELIIRKTAEESCIPVVKARMTEYGLEILTV